MTPEQLEVAVQQHVQAVTAAAWGSPPGGGHGWDQVMQHYGLQPAPAVDRVNEAASRGMTRGAIVSEVRRVLDAIAAWAQAQLSACGPGPIHGVLSVRFAQLASAEIQRYEAAVTPQRAPSVGSIFANASSTAGQAPWAHVKVSPSNVLVCVHCGAPQQTPLNFVCKYCSKPMAAPSRG